jgi:hypothetical protein
MSDFQAMGSALYGVLGTIQYSYVTNGTATVSGTAGVLPTRDTQVRQGTNPPYVIYQLQDSLDNYTFGTVSGESCDYLVKVVSDREFPTMQAYPIYDQMHNVLQDAALSISGAYPLRVRRISRVTPYLDEDKRWHVGGIYRVDFWHT